MVNQLLARVDEPETALGQRMPSWNGLRRMVAPAVFG
jgi:hypothetical protein